MDWVLLVTVLLDGITKEVAIQPLGWISCNIMQDSIPEKELKIDFNKIEIVKAECIKKS